MAPAASTEFCLWFCSCGLETAGVLGGSAHDEFMSTAARLCTARRLQVPSDFEHLEGPQASSMVLIQGRIVARSLHRGGRGTVRPFLCYFSSGVGKANEATRCMS